MNFIDEKNYLSICTFDFFHDLLETLFEFSAVFCTSEKHSEIERNELFIFKRFRNITFCNSDCETFNDCSLSCSRFSDQDRIIFCAARKNLHDACDFSVTTNYRIELVFASELDETASVFIENASFLWRIDIATCVIFEIFKSFFNEIFCETEASQNFASVAWNFKQCQKEMFCRNKFIFEFCSNL